MKIDWKYFITLLVALFTLGGFFVRFFQMQTRQNMEIGINKGDIKRLDKKLTLQAAYQIQTEKKVDVLCEKIDNVTKSMDEVKADIKTLLGRG